jgi:hypothetical protein
MLIKLKLAFEDKFRYQDGVPRVWRPEDDIDGLFRTAREETLALIPLFAKIAPQDPSLAFELPESTTHSSSNSFEDPDFDFEETLTVLTESKQAELAERFRRDADAYFLEAKRSMVSSISQIPYWMYGVIAILGWNEFIAVLRNPLYFTLLIILGAAAYITVQLNMVSQVYRFVASSALTIWDDTQVGPVTTLARGVGNEIYKVTNETLVSYYSKDTAALADALRRHSASISSNRYKDSWRPRTELSHCVRRTLRRRIAIHFRSLKTSNSRRCNDQNHRDFVSCNIRLIFQSQTLHISLMSDCILSPIQS